MMEDDEMVKKLMSKLEEEFHTVGLQKAKETEQELDAFINSATGTAERQKKRSWKPPVPKSPHAAVPASTEDYQKFCKKTLSWLEDKDRSYKSLEARFKVLHALGIPNYVKFVYVEPISDDKIPGYQLVFYVKKPEHVAMFVEHSKGLPISDFSIKVYKRPKVALRTRLKKFFAPLWIRTNLFFRMLWLTLTTALFYPKKTPKTPTLTELYNKKNKEDKKNLSNPWPLNHVISEDDKINYVKAKLDLIAAESNHKKNPNTETLTDFNKASDKYEECRRKFYV